MPEMIATPMIASQKSLADRGRWIAGPRIASIPKIEDGWSKENQPTQRRRINDSQTEEIWTKVSQPKESWRNKGKQVAGPTTASPGKRVIPVPRRSSSAKERGLLGFGELPWWERAGTSRVRRRARLEKGG